MSVSELISRPCRAVSAGLLALALLAPALASEPDPRVRELIAQLDLRQADSPSRDHPRWQPPRRVVVYFADPTHLAGLRAVAPDARIEAASDDPAQRRRQLARADVVIGGCSAANFTDAPGLRWFQAMSVGVENCVAVPGLAERQVVLTNMQRTSAPPIAEHAIAMTMALARGLPTYARAQQAGEWQRGAFGNARELGGRTLLVAWAASAPKSPAAPTAWACASSPPATAGAWGPTSSPRSGCPTNCWPWPPKPTWW